MRKMKKSDKKETSWLVPVVLLLILGILITGVKVLNEIYKKEEIPGKKIPAKKEKVVEKKEKKREKEIPVAIIIDDCGWNRSIVKELEGINEPLTLSFLPKAPYSKELIKLLNGKNYEFILHLPLEPLPPQQCLDKGLITTEMTDEEINKIFLDNVYDYLPYIKGINNHMGSLFTSTPDKMEVLLENIKKENLFFIDSATSKNTTGYTLAEQMGIKTAKRDIFLDNESNPEYIKEQLNKLIKVAKKNGKCVAIGHAKKETLKVLKEKLPELKEEGIKIVPASSIVE
ncbi:MAG TPA: divergent polysaccharide deacetylase family protein [Candidatus Ratteibacteria bacterium]|nr:divergent polysaccharide deacetylase family protein [Candidatus Ratteibacteria bacterium]